MAGVALLARGARRPRSALRGVLLAFQPLELGWFGGGEVKTLAKAEWLGGMPLLSGRVPAARLLPERTAAEAAAARGRASGAVRRLCGGAGGAGARRRRTRRTAPLREDACCGNWATDWRWSAMPAAASRCVAERRLRLSDRARRRSRRAGAGGPARRSSGKTLLDMARGRLQPTRARCSKARQLMRQLMAHYLGGQAVAVAPRIHRVAGCVRGTA